MSKLSKKLIIMDVANVLAMIKIEEFDNRDIFIEGLGNYSEIDKRIIKTSSISFGEIFMDDDVIYDTGKTIVSSHIIKMAKKVMKALGHSWDFKVYEHEEKDYPLLLFEEYSQIGFLIAPRNRDWKEKKGIEFPKEFFFSGDEE